MVVMRRYRELGQTPSLVDADHADEVRSPGTAEALRTVGAGHDTRRSSAGRVPQVGCVVGNLILGRNCSADAVAEIKSIGQLIGSGDVATTANQGVEVVGGIVPPRGVELGIGLTHREAGELNEGVVNADGIAARDARVLARAKRAGDVAVRRGPAEGRIPVGADHAVLGRGARIDVEVLARTRGVVVCQAVMRTSSTADTLSAWTRAAELRFDAQITTQLDAGVGAWNVEKSGTIQGADPHVLDRFGLDGKISCLSPAHGDTTRR